MRRRGLIPAHAGKTETGCCYGLRDGAHPRSRGENRVLVAQGDEVPGSSPLTRGKRPRYARHRTQSRLIPAHAGKTRKPARRRWSRRAHPRSRGENISAMRRAITCGGSSPLTRGKPRASLVRRAGLGLIPAHAGKTFPAGLIGGARRAHPRSRGENWLLYVSSCGVGGSSPLTRGKHAATMGAPRQGGLIPAHAGKTPARGLINCLV